MSKIQKTEIRRYKGRRVPAWLKILLGLGLSGLLVFALLLGQVLSGSRDDFHGEPKAMIILGCQVKPWGPSILLQDRLDRALDYLEDHPDLLVVVSGGQGSDEPMSEAQAMADYLEEHGISRETILLEDRSHNTMQNFAYSKEVLEQQGYDLEQGVLVVSNGFHPSPDAGGPRGLCGGFYPGGALQPSAFPAAYVYPGALGTGEILPL